MLVTFGPAQSEKPSTSTGRWGHQRLGSTRLALSGVVIGYSFHITFPQGELKSDVLCGIREESWVHLDHISSTKLSCI